MSDISTHFRRRRYVVSMAKQAAYWWSESSPTRVVDRIVQNRYYRQMDHAIVGE